MDEPATLKRLFRVIGGGVFILWLVGGWFFRALQMDKKSGVHDVVDFNEMVPREFLSGVTDCIHLMTSRGVRTSYLPEYNKTIAVEGLNVNTAKKHEGSGPPSSEMQRYVHYRGYIDQCLDQKHWFG